VSISVQGKLDTIQSTLLYEVDSGFLNNGRVEFDSIENVAQISLFELFNK